MSNSVSTNRNTQTSSPSPSSPSSSTDGGAQSSDEPAAGQSSALVPAERRARGDQSMWNSSRHIKVESEQPLKIPRKHRRKRRADSDLIGPPTKAYRRLLHRTLETTHRTAKQAEHLPPSQIGGSYWSEADKEAFLTALVTSRSHDLRGLASAVGTKSQAEIRAYVLLLRDQSSLLDERSSSYLEIAADIPASFEIVGHCEDVLEEGANHLARSTFEEDVKAEQRKFGQRWLIDEAWAAEIESNLEVSRSSGQADSTSPGSTGTSAGSTGNSADVPPSNASNQSVQEGEQARPRPPISASGSGPPSTHAKLEFLELFAASNFLQLSRTVFMNGRGEDNWQTIENRIDSEVATTPAIFLSAMDTFHSIAVDVTRKLVQTTLLQASSRIRARDGDSSPDAAVTASDVEVAMSLLEWPDWKTYWAKAPRRWDIDLHSEAKQYRDGRQTFKTGVQLTCHEVEAALGLNATKDQQQDSTTHIDESGTASTPEDEGISEDLSDEVPDPEWDDPEPEEEHFLESLDMQASQAEAHKILDLLERGRSPSTEKETEVRSNRPPIPVTDVDMNSVRAGSEGTNG